MLDLEERKMLARFRFPGERFRIVPEGTQDFYGMYVCTCVLTEDGYRVDHYESDPKAACSLLPRLMLTFNLAAARAFMDSLTTELQCGCDENVCRFIADAVRKVQQERTL